MDIYYEIIGEGFPLVLLHGNNEDHHVFDEAVKLLAKEYQCILIDSRYHGQSIQVIYHISKCVKMFKQL